MKIFDHVISAIDAGKRGENQGLSMGFNRMVDVIPNLQKRNMYVLGGETGTGKSAFAMTSFIYNPYEDFITNFKEKIKFKAFIWSMELDKDILLTKAICRRLWINSGILVDINFVLSRGKNRISQEVYDLVLRERTFFEEFEDYVEILRSDNPTGVRNVILNYMDSIGKTTHKTITTIDKETGESKEVVIRDRYIPDNEQTYTVVLLDHIVLLKNERGYGKKEKIDKMTEYLIDMRDFLGISPVIVQQLNRDLSSIDRVKANRLAPQLSDFKESSDTTDAANFVMALFSPMRYEMQTYRDYIINPRQGGLADKFKSMHILKTRDGVADKVLGMGFIGEVGQFFELPKQEDMTTEIYNLIRENKYK